MSIPRHSREQVVTKRLVCGAEVVVSAQDTHLLEKRWHLNTMGYVIRLVRRPDRDHLAKQTLHREIMVPPEGLFVDHVNGNKLDNRRSNLRLCTTGQNNMNRLPNVRGVSRYKGVCWSKKSQRWKAAIKINRRLIYLGLWDNEEDAARAYDAAASEHFGPFAWLNFPEAYAP